MYLYPYSFNNLFGNSPFSNFSTPTYNYPSYNYNGFGFSLPQQYNNSLLNLYQQAISYLYGGGYPSFNAYNPQQHGTNGNDTLYGSWLSDDMYGYRGDDALHGGAGNDHLYGGAGNDLLDGGSGIDTAIFDGRREDYTVKTEFTDVFNNQPSGIAPAIAQQYVTVTHNQTGETDRILLRPDYAIGFGRNTENQPTTERLQFSNGTFNTRDLINNNPTGGEATPLPLTNEQQSNIYEHYGIANSLAVNVQDGNGDGQLGPGDIVIISGGVTGGEIARHTISPSDFDAIAGVNGGNDSSIAAQNLNQNRLKWNNNNFSNFSFQLDRSAFLPPELRRPIIVNADNNGNISSVFADDNQPVPADYSYVNTSINDVFDLIQDAINSNAAKINVTYNQQLGYPSSIFIDYSEQIADEELSLTISNLQGNLF